jgi:hypothetical protein
MDATAGSLVVGDAVLYFVCSLRSCSERLPPDATLEELWDYCSDSQHTMGLLEQGHYRCEIGCQEGFADPVHRLSHYGKARCTNEELPDNRCFEPGCTWTPTQPSGKRTKPQRAKFLQHYVAKHAREAYNKHDAPFQDNTCNLGFRSKATLFFHCVGGVAAQGRLLGRTRDSGHRDRVLKQLIAGANLVSDDSRPASTNNSFPAIHPLEIRGEHVKHDPIMCRPTDASPSSQVVIISSPTQDRDWPLWRTLIQSTQHNLPSMHSRITFPGDSKMTFSFVADGSLSCQGVSSLAEKDIDLQVTHATRKVYDSSQVLEPHPSVMPRYRSLPSSLELMLTTKYCVARHPSKCLMVSSRS